MNINDFNKWLNEELPEPESEKMTENIMSELKEYRLKEQFKQRLKARRERRELMKYGLIAVGFVGAIGLLMLMIWREQQPVSLSQTPTETSIYPEKPVSEQPLLTTVLPTKDSTSFRTKNNLPIAVDSAINVVVETKPPFLKDYKPNNIKPADPIAFVRPPIDTEYLYVTSSERRPVYFYSETTNNVKDTFTTLDLSKEKLTTIPPSVFPYTQLKILLLNRNLLKNLPDEMAQLIHLEQFDASRNKLTALPNAFSGLTELTNLNLESNKLTALPTSIGALTQLKTVNLSNNKLTKLPLSIGQWTQLTTLDLSENTLAVLPNELGQCTELTDLNANENLLKELPNSIGNLINLTNLEVNNNRLWKLPKEIGQLTALKTLDLSKNYLSNLPKEIKNLKNLTYLDLRENSIGYDEIQKIKIWLPNCRVDY